MKNLLLIFLLAVIQLTVELSRAEDAPVASPTPPLRHRDRVKPQPRSKSKYTSDRTEEDADHRTLEPIAMGMDKIVDLETDEVTDDKLITVGNPAVVAKPGPIYVGKRVKQLIFKGVGEGETNVIVRKPDGAVIIIFDCTVAKQNVVRLLGDLKKSLREVEGIDIHLEGSKIVLDGEVLTPNDYGRVANVLSDPVYGPTVVSNRIVMSPVSLNALANKIQGDIQVFAPTTRVSVLNGKIILEGTVDGENVKKRAAVRAEWYLPSARVSDPINKDPNIEKNDKNLMIIQNDIQVQPPEKKRDPKLVRLTVHFVELNKDYLKQFGFKWQPGFTADPSISIGQSQAGSTSTSGAGGFTFSGTLSSLFPALNSAQSAGYGRTLKSVTGVVKSEQEYHVKDLTDYPTTTVSPQGAGNGTPVQTGLDMKVTPTILSKDDLDVQIKLTQKDVVGKGANGTPMVSTHDVETRIFLKSGEVSGIAALNNQAVSTSFNRDDPNSGSFGAAQNGAAPTRPLWNLLRSKNYSKQRGQFVIFVSPQIVTNASEGTEDLKKNYRMPSGSR